MSYNYGNLPEYKEEEEEEQSCEILDTSIYVSGGKMSDNSSQESYDNYDDYDWNDPSSIADCTTPLSPAASDPHSHSHSHSHFDLTDPLRYCLEHGVITPNEYDKWKIVDETPAAIANAATKPSKRKTKPIDFGAGYNDTDDTDNTDTDTEDEISKSYYCYGNGYVTQFPSKRIQPSSAFVYDPWFPNPDPTPNKQYTRLATSARHMMTQFVVFESDGEQPRLNHAFQLKLIWERFMISSQSSQPLQDFWQTNALTIYEALQELVVIHTKSRCFNPLSGARKLIPDTPDTPTPEFHTTPVEMLENTFETIGRMSRCIADDFNTQSIVNYVEEFIHALYTELYFMALLQGTLSPVSPLAYGTEGLRESLRHRGKPL